MRKKMVSVERKFFMGMVDHFSEFYSGRYCTHYVLIKNIKDSDGNIVCKRHWFFIGEGFKKLKTLITGDTVKFMARFFENSHGEMEFVYPTKIDFVDYYEYMKH